MASLWRVASRAPRRPVLGRHAVLMVAALGAMLAATPIIALAVAGPSFSVTGPASAPVNTAFNITVAALDPNLDPDPTYTGNVALTSTDGAATLPAAHTFTTGSGGETGFMCSR